jgi:SAM-dependent methyltransferase
MTIGNRFPNARRYARERGVAWTALYGIRRILLRPIDNAMLRIERRRFLIGPTTISASNNTVSENLRLWDEWDWSQSGAEWTEVARRHGLDPQTWKTAIVDGLMRKQIAEGATALEIGPGAGRWTAHLQEMCERLIAADISPRCLDICKQRFEGCENVEFQRILDGDLGFVPDEHLDAIWSYDVFVHINPSDTDHYLSQFPRILKPGGTAIIHHPGAYPSERARRTIFRSSIDGAFFAHLARRHGLELVYQSGDFAHVPWDLVSVLRKPSGSALGKVQPMVNTPAPQLEGQSPRTRT